MSYPSKVHCILLDKLSLVLNREQKVIEYYENYTIDNDHTTITIDDYYMYII